MASVASMTLILIQCGPNGRLRAQALGLDAYERASRMTARLDQKKQLAHLRPQLHCEPFFAFPLRLTKAGGASAPTGTRHSGNVLGHDDMSFFWISCPEGHYRVIILYNHLVSTGGGGRVNTPRQSWIFRELPPVPPPFPRDSTAFPPAPGLPRAPACTFPRGLSSRLCSPVHVSACTRTARC